MLFLLITDKRGALLCIRAVASSGARGWGRHIFLKCVWTPSANSLSHTFPWNIFKIKQDSRPGASLLCRCSWKNFEWGGQKATKQAYFSPFFDREFARTERKRPVFHDKTSASASDTMHFSFYPLDTTQTESRAHRTLSLNPTHQGPETLLWRIFFLSI